MIIIKICAGIYLSFYFILFMLCLVQEIDIILNDKIQQFKKYKLEKLKLKINNIT